MSNREEAMQSWEGRILSREHDVTDREASVNYYANRIAADAAGYDAVKHLLKQHYRTAEGRDRLQALVGIDDKAAELLKDAGIRNFERLAESSIGELTRLLEGAGPRFALANPLSWAEQANAYLAEDWVTLDRLQAELNGEHRDDIARGLLDAMSRKPDPVPKAAPAGAQGAQGAAGSAAGSATGTGASTGAAAAAAATAATGAAGAAGVAASISSFEAPATTGNAYATGGYTGASYMGSSGQPFEEGVAVAAGLAPTPEEEAGGEAAGENAAAAAAAAAGEAGAAPEGAGSATGQADGSAQGASGASGAADHQNTPGAANAGGEDQATADHAAPAPAQSVAVAMAEAMFGGGVSASAVSGEAAVPTEGAASAPAEASGSDASTADTTAADATAADTADTTESIAEELAQADALLAEAASVLAVDQEAVARAVQSGSADTVSESAAHAAPIEASIEQENVFWESDAGDEGEVVESSAGPLASVFINPRQRTIERVAAEAVEDQPWRQDSGDISDARIISGQQRDSSQTPS